MLSDDKRGVKDFFLGSSIISVFSFYRQTNERLIGVVDKGERLATMELSQNSVGRTGAHEHTQSPRSIRE